ncbi:hypothetical protein [Stenotrophomonas oahuensis]|uniref:Uncharacterized protein n=1 Tax=Stenotrophomonas oahuensis TaxID=3003271 RepID=A0ABY9YW78_9GAMM|nr:hypothetical protein [Stenotrophomonas sp. A5586]WNH54841.1 hypothetical protein PDM29_20725 [Stenotrophomonas sp. A5586]
MLLVKMMPFLANSAGQLDPAKLILAFTFASLATLFIQFFIAKLVWKATAMQSLQVGAISLVGLVGAASPYTIFLFPLALLGSHVWVAYRRRAVRDARL